MADLLVTSTGGADFEFELIPADSYLARLVKIIDLGTFTPEKGKFAKHQHKVRLVWELSAYFFKEPDSEGRPRIATVSKDYLLSIGEKANLRKDLVAWRGKDFTEEELKGFSLQKLLGGTCMLGVKHEDDKSDATKKWVKISSIMKVPTGTVVPAQTSASVFFNQADENDQNIVTLFKDLSDYEKKIIQSSDEWKARLPRIAGMVDTGTASAVQATTAGAPAGTPVTDDAPF